MTLYDHLESIANERISKNRLQCITPHEMEICDWCLIPVTPNKECSCQTDLPEKAVTNLATNN